MADSLVARKYFDGIYIPMGLIVFGTFITKREWSLYAVILALSLGAWKFTSMRKSFLAGVLARSRRSMLAIPISVLMVELAEPKKVLKPDAFQEFELKEKTVISHNVAM